MSTDRDDEKLESYLRQFRALAPRPLPPAATSKFRRASAILAAIAAIFGAAFAVATWHSNRPVSGEGGAARVADHSLGDISMLRLGRIAQEGSVQLDSSLTELSKDLLPDTRTSQGVLKELSSQ
jgi:hypothetical protein